MLWYHKKVSNGIVNTVLTYEDYEYCYLCVEAYFYEAPFTVRAENAQDHLLLANKISFIKAKFLLWYVYWTCSSSHPLISPEKGEREEK